MSKRNGAGAHDSGIEKKEAFLCDVILHHQKNAISEMPAEP
ncbi:hypothetical protein [Megasphaera sp. UBA4352]